jgi:hypothetical protein
MVASNLVDTLTGLVTSRSHTSQVCGLRELAQLSLAADAVASHLLTPRLLVGLVVGAASLRRLSSALIPTVLVLRFMRDSVSSVSPSTSLL